MPVNDGPLDDGRLDDGPLEAIAARLSGAVEAIDPAPIQAFDLARAAIGMRSLDAQLLDLVRDSAEITASVRGDGDDRLLSFEAPAEPGHRAGIVVEAQISDDHGRRNVMAHLPDSVVDARVETADGVVDSDLDAPDDAHDDRLLTAYGLAPGPVRLVLTTEDGARLVTSWVSV